MYINISLFLSLLYIHTYIFQAINHVKFGGTKKKKEGDDWGSEEGIFKKKKQGML